MKEYELIIQSNQPPCGGKDSKASEIMEVETDDLLAFVRAREKDVEPVLEEARPGVSRVSFVRNRWTVTYEFTEI